MCVCVCVRMHMSMICVCVCVCVHTSMLCVCVLDREGSRVVASSHSSSSSSVSGQLDCPTCFCDTLSSSYTRYTELKNV